jgi:hypothetical protein
MTTRPRPWSKPVTIALALSPELYRQLTLGGLGRDRAWVSRVAQADGNCHIERALIGL